MNGARVLQLDRILKDFPGVRALDSASLSIAAGEIHGLVGENGAGKSTIIKVLAGVYTPEEGRLEIHGQEIDPITPASVHEAGIRFIHQELQLVPHFTVTESVFMGQERSARFGIDARYMRRQTESFLQDTLAVDIPGSALIRNLGTAERKLVQIACALIDDKAKIVVFDEPTAPLASDEIRTLMHAIRRLNERGISILYVSHYLNEITDICDRVTVFRHGRDVKVLDDVHDNSGPELVSAMVGRSLSDIYPPRERKPGGLTLQLEGLTGAAFEDVSLTLREGEILGIAGVIGSGREQLIDTIYGLKRPASGTIRLKGSKISIRAPADAIAQGIVLVPRDRRNDGLVLPMTVSENINLATLDEVSTGWIENRDQARVKAELQIGSLDIHTPGPDTIVRLLSGGNQQKVVLGRWLLKHAHVFLMDGPTVGVDVGARSEIYALIDRLAKQGSSVIVSSSDPAELIGLCDRIVVMMRGRVVDLLDAASHDIDDLIAISTGARTAEAGRG